MLTLLSSICSRSQISAETTNELASLFRQQAAQSEGLSNNLELKLASNERCLMEQNRRTRDMELQRSRLEKDLVGRTERVSLYFC